MSHVDRAADVLAGVCWDVTVKFSGTETRMLRPRDALDALAAAGLAVVAKTEYDSIEQELAECKSLLDAIEDDLAIDMSDYIDALNDESA